MRWEIVVVCILLTGVFLASCTGTTKTQDQSTDTDIAVTHEPDSSQAPEVTSAPALIVVGCGGGDFDSGNTTG